MKTEMNIRNDIEYCGVPTSFYRNLYEQLWNETYLFLWPLYYAWLKAFSNPSTLYKNLGRWSK